MLKRNSLKVATNFVLGFDFFFCAAPKLSLLFFSFLRQKTKVIFFLVFFVRSFVRHSSEKVFEGDDERECGSLRERTGAATGVRMIFLLCSRPTMRSFFSVVSVVRKIW